MATIGDDPNGRKRILFVSGDGKRRTIRLGKASQRQAEAFRVKVESLIGAGITGSVDDETSRFVAALDDTIHARLAAVGLVKARNRSAMPLGAFLDAFFASVTVKASTATTYKQTKRVLIEYFGESQPLREIGPAEADRWRQWMKVSELADSTIARRVKCARQIFRRASKWKLIADNPFADVTAGSQTNKARMFFITRDVAQKVLDACPDAQWRLLFALSRFGGLRCPSEHLALKWSDVNWDKGRIRVPSSKTEHIEGGDCRFIPLFPELRGPLLEVFEAAEPGTESVITRYRNANQNLRTQLLRIIASAGVKPWPKLWHNLRSTRQTELAERYPIHVVCAWLGNSRAVAQEHYLQVTDSHFSHAAHESGTVSAGVKPESPNGTALVTTSSAAQNPAQYTSESARMGQNCPAPQMQNRSVLPSDSAEYETVQSGSVTPTGFEPVSRP